MCQYSTTTKNLTKQTAPTEKMADVLQRTIKEAKEKISKVQDELKYFRMKRIDIHLHPHLGVGQKGRLSH